MLARRHARSADGKPGTRLRRRPGAPSDNRYPPERWKGSGLRMITPAAISPRDRGVLDPHRSGSPKARRPCAQRRVDLVPVSPMVTGHSSAPDAYGGAA